MRRGAELVVAVAVVVGTVGCGGGDGSSDAVSPDATTTDVADEASAAPGDGVPAAGTMPSDLALPSGIELTGPTLVQSETEFVVSAEIVGNIEQIASAWVDNLEGLGWDVRLDASDEDSWAFRATKPGRVVDISLEDTGAEKLPLAIRGYAP